jgi:hypothetical protein
MHARAARVGGTGIEEDLSHEQGGLKPRTRRTHASEARGLELTWRRAQEAVWQQYKVTLLEKVWKFSALVYSLYKITINGTFQVTLPEQRFCRQN